MSRRIDEKSHIFQNFYYSTDFRDSTMSIFLSFLCIKIFTMIEKIQVITAQYTKLIGRMFLPNMTASTSTVTVQKNTKSRTEKDSCDGENDIFPQHIL